MVKEGESGEVPVAHVLGDIDFCTVPFTLLKTDPCCIPGAVPQQGLLTQPHHSAGGKNPTSPGLEEELNPLNEGLAPLE